MGYDKPVVVDSNDIAEGVYAASGNTVAFSLDHIEEKEGGGTFWNINTPANYVGKPCQINIKLSGAITYFDCRNGNFADGHMADSNTVAVAYSDAAGANCQFAFVPKTVSVIGVEYKDR